MTRYPTPEENGPDHYGPGHSFYWWLGGRVLTVDEIEGFTTSEERGEVHWDQYDQLRKYLDEKVQWYLQLLSDGGASIPACRRRGDRPGGVCEVHRCLAEAYEKIRELKGRVAVYRDALVKGRVPRQASLF